MITGLECNAVQSLLEPHFVDVELLKSRRKQFACNFKEKGKNPNRKSVSQLECTYPMNAVAYYYYVSYFTCFHEVQVTLSLEKGEGREK